MNDQPSNDTPLNDTELDARIRALMADAVAETPPAPPMPSLDSPLAPVVQLRRTGRSWGMVAAAAGVAAALVAAVVWMSNDNDRTITPATTEAPTPDGGWPADVAVIIADGSGNVQRVTASWGEDGGLGYFGPTPVGLAFELADGTVLTDADSTDGQLLDVAGSGEVLRQTAEAQDNLRAFGPDGTSRVIGDLFSELEWCTFDGDLSLRCKASDSSMVGGPDFSGLEPYHPAAFTWSGDALVAVVGGQVRRYFADGQQSPPIELGGVAGWTYVDASDDVAVISREDGPGVLVDFRTGLVHPLPVAGRATISFNRNPTTVPVTTVSTTNSSTTVSPGTSSPAVTPAAAEVPSIVVTAGPDGVWRVVDGLATQLTAEPMSMALQLPDGSVIMQRSSGWTFDGDQADTTPLVWRNGELSELFTGEALDGWVRLYDVAMVNGEMTLLYAVEQEAQPQSVLVESVLLARSLATWETTVVDPEFGGWEQGYSRMHLAENGLIVGEFYQEVVRQFVSYSLPGGEPLTADQFDLESSYTECNDCPRLYTVRRDGNIVAWLDGTVLRLATPDLTAEEQFDLGDVALEATDLELGNGFVVLSFGWGDPGAAGPVIVDLNSGAVTPLSGTVAAIVTIPTAPWEVDPRLTAPLQGKSFGSPDDVYAVVEALIEANTRYAAVDPLDPTTFTQVVEPITFTRFVLPDGSLAISVPNSDDAVPETWFRIGQGLTIERIEFVDVCRNGTYSTPATLCV